MILAYGPPAVPRRYTLYPTTEEVLGLHESETVCCTICPVPLKVPERSESEALLINERLPETAPLTNGENVTVKATLCPAARVRGRLRPPTVNWEVFEVTDDMVTLDPVALRTPFWFELVPTETVPNPKDPGETDNWPGAEPAPDSGTLTLGSEALELKFNIPLSVPEVVGVNAKVNVRLCPAANVVGAVKPLKLNPAPLKAAWEIKTLEPPEFVSVGYCNWVLPRVTFPKLSLEGTGVKYPGVAPVPESE